MDPNEIVTLSSRKSGIVKRVKRSELPKYGKPLDYISVADTFAKGIMAGQLDINAVPQERRAGVSAVLGEQGYDPTKVELEKEEKKKKIGAGVKREEEFGKFAPVLTQLFNEFETVPEWQRGPGKEKITTTFGFLFPEATTYQEGVKALAGSIKGFVGEAGQLTNYDIERIIAAFPHIGDTPKQVEIKRERINGIFQERFGKSLFGEQEKVSQGLGERIGDIPVLGGLSKPFIQTGKNVAGSGFELARGLDFLLGNKQAYAPSPQGGGQAAIQNPFIPQEQLEQTRTNPLGYILGQTLPAAEAASTLYTAGALPKILSAGKKKIGIDGIKSSLLNKIGVGAKAQRVNLIEKAEQTGQVIDGTEIANHFVKWSNQAIRGNPGKEKQVERIITSVVNNNAGKPLTPKDAMKMWLDADNAFTKDGVMKTALESKVDAEMRRVLRPLLEKIAPGFDKTTKAIATNIKSKKIAEWLAKGAAGAAVGGISYAILGKILGQNRNQ